MAKNSISISYIHSPIKDISGKIIGEKPYPVVPVRKRWFFKFIQTGYL